MSHAYGEVIKDDQVVGHFEYNGTCDVAIGKIYRTQQEVSENWRSGNMGLCLCGQAPSNVILYADYGNGFHWNGEACLQCMAIVGGRDPWNSNFIEYNTGYGGYPVREPIGPYDGHPLR